MLPGCRGQETLWLAEEDCFYMKENGAVPNGAVQSCVGALYGPCDVTQ